MGPRARAPVAGGDTHGATRVAGGGSSGAHGQVVHKKRPHGHKRDDQYGDLVVEDDDGARLDFLPHLLAPALSLRSARGKRWSASGLDIFGLQHVCAGAMSPLSGTATTRLAACAHLDLLHAKLIIGGFQGLPYVLWARNKLCWLQCPVNVFRELELVRLCRWLDVFGVAKEHLVARALHTPGAPPSPASCSRSERQEVDGSRSYTAKNAAERSVDQRATVETRKQRVANFSKHACRQPQLQRTKRFVLSAGEMQPPQWLLHRT